MKTQNDSGFRTLVEQAKAQGFQVERTNGGHWKFTPPNRQYRIFYAAFTPRSSTFFLDRFRADLKRHGCSLSS